MGDLTRDSDRLLSEGRALVRDNREGGRHRRAGSIGKGSAEIKLAHWRQKLLTIAAGMILILTGATVAGFIVDGIGFWGVMGVILLSVLMFTGVGMQRVKVPTRADLTKGDVHHLVGRTELWLEAQRPALPAPAAKIVDDMGVQLDALGLQLEGLDQSHPSAQEIRKLVGEVLPETIDAYRRIPTHLRSEVRAGATPDQQLTESLGKISKEIDSVTRQLAEGSLDELAIHTRYLSYRYGDGGEVGTEGGAGVPLPDFSKEKTPG